MLKARLGKEIVVTMPNEIGVLAQLIKIVADKGINITAINTWETGNTATMCMMTDDNLRVMDALTQGGYGPRETEVVVAELAHKPGMIRRITEKLAYEGVDLQHFYLTAGITEDRCTLVFGSSNNERAMIVINESP